MRDSDVFMFDEPSSYLDVKQRMQAARTIRTLLKHDKCVLFHYFLDIGKCFVNFIRRFVKPRVHSKDVFVI